MDDLNVTLRYAVRRECKGEWQDKEEVIDFYNLAFVLEGKVTYWIDGKEFVVEKNQAILIPADSKRKVYSDGGVFQSFDFYIDREYFELEGYVFDVESMDYLKRLFKDFNRYWFLKQRHYMMRCKSAFYNILFTFLKQCENPTSNYHVKEMMHYIQAHYLEKVTVRDLAALTGLNPIYCGALFNRFVGNTVSQYIHQLRILHAEILLGESDINISEVAFRSGFEDIYYFSKVFKQIKGVSPSQYRKNILE